MTEINNPEDLEWIEGDLPDVHTVSKEARILAWIVYDNPTVLEQIRKGQNVGAYQPVKKPELTGKFKTIKMDYPWKDKLNPLRWVDGFPIGFEEKVKYYAWVQK